MKKSIAFLLMFVMMFSYAVPSYTVYGKTLSQLQEEQKKIREQKTNAQKQLIEAQSQKQTAAEELAVLDQQLIKEEKELEKIEAELAETNARMEVAQAELDIAIADSEKQLAAFQKRIRYIHENGSIGYLKIIFQSESFNDFIKRLQYVKDIMAYDEEILSRLRATQNTIQEKTDLIADEKLAIEKLVADQQAVAQSVQDRLDQKQAAYAQIEQDELKYEQIIADNEKASQEVANLIAQASGSTSGAVYTGNGIFQWPVPSRSGISSGYGYRNRPIGSGTEFHTGYDIPASYGSNVVAAEAGTVITSRYVNGYGYTVIINHGSGLTTLYGHNSKLVVSQGETVVKGQVIAKIGSTGNSTGNHCHFEIRKNGQHVNPKDYLGV